MMCNIHKTENTSGNPSDVKTREDLTPDLYSYQCNTEYGAINGAIVFIVIILFYKAAHMTQRVYSLACVKLNTSVTIRVQASLIYL